MSLTDHFTTTFTVKRMTWQVDGYGNEYSSLADVSLFDGHLQQSDMELAQNLGFAFNKTFTIWCSLTADVEEGDNVYDGTYIYHVKAKQTFYNGDNKHTELVCLRELSIESV